MRILPSPCVEHFCSATSSSGWITRNPVTSGNTPTVAMTHLSTEKSLEESPAPQAAVGWNSYPFQPRQQLDWCFTILMLCLGTGFVWVFAQIHRNPILS